MTLSISVVTLERDVRKVAEARPDHIYAKFDGTDGAACFYDHDAEGEGPDHACVIGAGISRQCPFDQMWEHYNGDVADLLTDTVESDDETRPYFKIIDEVDEGVVSDTMRWLLAVQVNQDQSKDWATAVRLADEARANGWEGDDDRRF